MADDSVSMVETDCSGMSSNRTTALQTQQSSTLKIMHSSWRCVSCWCRTHLFRVEEKLFQQHTRQVNSKSFGSLRVSRQTACASVCFVKQRFHVSLSTGWKESCESHKSDGLLNQTDTRRHIIWPNKTKAALNMRGQEKTQETAELWCSRKGGMS